MLKVIYQMNWEKYVSIKCETENGNGIMHVMSAFIDTFDMTNNSNIYDEKNKNGWTPMFMAYFKGTELMQKNLTDKSIDRTLDYFGNDAYFYLKNMV